MIRWIVSLIFLFLFLVGCTPTNETLTELTGGDAATKTTTVPGDLGNQAFTFSPTSYDFGNRAMNSAPVSTTVTITNISTYNILISNLGGPGSSFSLVSDNCPRSPTVMVPNQACSATVSFAPTAGGSFNSSLIVTYGASITNTNAYTATMGLSGTGVGTLSFAGISSVSNIYSTQLKLNWTHVAGANIYYIFRVNADGSQTYITNVSAPTTNYIVSGLTASTSYKFWVRATDVLGAYDTNVNVVTTSTNSTPASPSLIGYSNYTFASGGSIALGSTLNMDLDDVRTGLATDAGVTYSCAFDQVIDSSVTASGNCASVPSGTLSFSTTSGALSWSGTTTPAIGFYEFKVGVTDNTSSLTDQAIFTVAIRPSYTTANLIGNYSSMFSSGISSQTTSTTWQDLTSTNADGTLTNFTFGGPYGWQGSGVAASPHSIVFDGSNDYVDIGTQGSGATSMTLETFYRPTAINTSPIGYIASNGDAGNKGLTLREAKGYRNRVEGFIGNKTYADEIMDDSPYVYLRMGDVSGDTPYDIGSGGLSWTLTGVTTYELTSPLGGNDKAILFNGLGSYYTGNVVNTSVGGWTGVTYEGWARIDTLSTYPTFFALDTQQATRSFYWFFINGAGTTLALQYVADGAVRTASVAFAPVLGTWYHYAYTLDFTTKELNLYINGANVLNTTVPYTTILQSNDNRELKVGTYSQGSAAHSLNGAMDEAAVYKSALSGARIAAHFNAKANYFEILSNRLTNNVFNHHALTYDEWTSSLNFYTNSVNEGSTSTSAVTLNGTTANFALGAKLPSTGNPSASTFSAGVITDARIYDIAHSASTIKSNMVSQIHQFDWPKAHSNLLMWFDANDLTTLYKTTDCSTTPVTANGDAVACWKDKSGSNNHITQGTAAQQPTYKTSNASLNNMPSLTFGAAAYSMLTSPSVSVGQRTYFVVSRTNGNANGAYHRLVIQNGGNFYNLLADNTTASYYNGAFFNSSTSYTGNQIHSLVHNATTATYRVNQSQVLSATTAPGVLANSFSIGGYSGGNGFNGEILEVIIYDRALSNSEVYRIEGYLRAKYGL